jgi:hypothetical protein
MNSEFVMICTKSIGLSYIRAETLKENESHLIPECNRYTNLFERGERSDVTVL